MAVEIKHLAGAEEAIDDNTRIVRYMKLSTLLLLLADRVFLPSLRCLQSYDKLEGVLPQRLSVFQDYGTQLYPKVQPFEDWLLQQAKSPKVIPVQGGKHTRTTLHFLTKVWAEQLAIRRCVWCWNKHSGQSYALWEIYGKRGVALVTTVGAVKRALEKAGVLRAIVSPVSYSIPPGFLLEEDFFEEAARQSIQMVRKENLAFPYLFKDGGYKYEQEVRFVFGVHPNL